MAKLKQTGKIKAKSSISIKKSKIGLGFEKLDRDIFDPEDSYPFVAESGIKWARLQSGWQKTEQKEGVYDFEWLDKIVDKMISIGVEPWLCLCYGNQLYTKSAEKVFGAVGVPPIFSESEREAWKNYVKATVEHFKGRIHYYEVWNEPDGVWCWKHGPNPKELAKFTTDTAKICKETDETCEVVGMVTCCKNPDFHKELCDNGACEYLDAISYHAYTHYDKEFVDTFKFYDDLRKKYKKDLKIIQGESGTQSRSDGCGALAGGGWTELKQAKFLLRHLITDLAMEVEFTSYFSCMDMAEALNGETGNLLSISDFGYFGVVGADFDENSRATGNYHAKMSYYALQNITSIMCEDFNLCNIKINPKREFSYFMLGDNYDFANSTSYAFKREDNSTAVFYWHPSNLLTETYEGETSFEISTDDVCGDVKLVNMLSGDVYSLNEDNYIIEDGYYKFKNLPISDVPMMLDFNGFYKEK